MHSRFDEEWFARLLAARASQGTVPAPGAHESAAAADSDSDAGGRLQDWGEPPDTAQFVGRRDELALLQSWMLEDHCRVVAVLGMGGIGNSISRTKIFQRARFNNSDPRWRVLANARWGSRTRWGSRSSRPLRWSDWAPLFLLLIPVVGAALAVLVPVLATLLWNPAATLAVAVALVLLQRLVPNVVNPRGWELLCDARQMHRGGPLGQGALTCRWGAASL